LTAALSWRAISTWAAFSAPAWVRTATINSVFETASFHARLNTGEYWNNGEKTFNQMFTFTRASSAWFIDPVTGLRTTYGVNVPIMNSQGFIDEPFRQNVINYSNDGTNAAWTKTNMTVAMNATGIDGVANSATTMTNTAANGTITQPEVSAADRCSFVWLKKDVTSGATDVQMTLDGAAWTTMATDAQLSTTVWTRFVNPFTLDVATTPSGVMTLNGCYGGAFRTVVGLRLTGATAVVAFSDFNEQNGRYPTSPIPTTNATVSREQGLLKFAMPLTSIWPSMSRGTMIVRGKTFDDVDGGTSLSLERAANFGYRLLLNDRGIDFDTPAPDYSSQSGCTTAAGGVAKGFDPISPPANLYTKDVWHVVGVGWDMVDGNGWIVIDGSAVRDTTAIGFVPGDWDNQLDTGYIGRASVGNSRNGYIQEIIAFTVTAKAELTALTVV
jgi:hypothetical protein